MHATRHSRLTGVGLVQVSLFSFSSSLLSMVGIILFTFAPPYSSHVYPKWQILIPIPSHIIPSHIIIKVIYFFTSQYTTDLITVIYTFSYSRVGSYIVDDYYK